jgi:hypothetical protein
MKNKFEKQLDDIKLTKKSLDDFLKEARTFKHPDNISEAYETYKLNLMELQLKATVLNIEIALDSKKKLFRIF